MFVEVGTNQPLTPPSDTMTDTIKTLKSMFEIDEDGYQAEVIDVFEACFRSGRDTGISVVSIKRNVIINEDSEDEDVTFSVNRTSDMGGDADEMVMYFGTHNTIRGAVLAAKEALNTPTHRAFSGLTSLV